jgi:hypothetical protein
VDDRITVDRSDDCVRLVASDSLGASFTVYLSAADAREFARAIKKSAKLAEKAEGLRRFP